MTLEAGRLNVGSQPLRVALLGAGGIAPEHADVLRRLPNVRMAAVCDLDSLRARELAERYAVPEVFSSALDMLQRSNPDVVHVLLPPGDHVRLAIQCLEAGANVFLEKPLGISAAECGELRRVAEASGLAVGVNHNMVYRPVIQRLVGEVRARRFGRLAHVNIAWSMPPDKVREAAPSRFFLQAPQNVLLEWAVHPLSVVRRLLGRFKRAEALVSAEMRTASGRPFFSSWQASLECERGTAQLLLSAGGGYDCCWMDVLGEDALAHVDVLKDSMVLSEYSPYRPAMAGFRDSWADTRRLFSSARRNAASYVLAGLGRPVPISPGTAGMHGSIRAFYGALARGEAPPEGIEQGTAVVEYCEGIFKSAFQQAPVGAR